MISAEGIGKRYGTFIAVHDVSFHAGSGEILGILGPNGAGKTTILKMLTGYHFPSSGDVFIDGNSVVRQSMAAKKLIGYLPENAPLYGDLGVSEFLRFAAGMHGLKGRMITEAVKKVLVLCDLMDVSGKKINRLSKGYRQRVGIAQALIHDPPILILDEPTSGLDPLQILEIRKLVQRLGENKTILFSSHIMQEVESVCTKIIILDNGRIIAEGTGEEIAGKLKQEYVYELSLSGADNTTILTILSKAKGYLSAERIDSTSNTSQKFRVSLSIKDSDEAGALLFRLAADNGLILSKLTPVHYGLEDVFTVLTKHKDAK